MRKKFLFGPAFSENVHEVGRRLKVSSKDRLERANRWSEKGILNQFSTVDSHSMSKWRVSLLLVLFIFVFIILLARSFELQVIEGDKFLGKSEGNRYKVRTTHAPRGIVYDRNGVVLARNVPSFRVAADPKSISVEDRQRVLSKLSEILNEPKKELDKKLDGEYTDSITLVENATHEMILKLEAEDLPGIEAEISPRRKFEFSEAFAHLLGYTGEVTQEDLDNPNGTPHVAGDRVGRYGVEQTFENILRGANGYDLIKVDAAGKRQGSLVSTEPISGNDITLSIDADLQKRVFKVLKKWIKNSSASSGSAIVMDPNTGEILALVSYPSFDGNKFEIGMTQSQYNLLVNNSNKPLLNRAIGASYPPGSTFKLVTAAAGLESGAITKNTKIVDTGFVKLGDQVFNNWLWLDSKRTDGSISIVRAIARSNDTFFYKLGQMVGEERIQQMAQTFLLGSFTGINLPGESKGLVPTEQWKLDTKGEVWFPGETLNLAIGQGDLLVSPLQLSLVTSVFANGGNLIKPTVLKTDDKEIISKDFVSSETIATIREGMFENTKGDGNVSYLFNNFKVRTAGKTGTAESGSERPHAWYTAFAPFEKPEIVVTVMVENAGHGSEVSAPATKEIFNWYFSKK